MSTSTILVAIGTFIMVGAAIWVWSYNTMRFFSSDMGAILGCSIGTGVILGGIAAVYAYILMDASDKRASMWDSTITSTE